MPLRPDDVLRRSFATSALLRRGYDETEVDTFVEEVVVALRRLYARIDELEAEAATSAGRTPAAEMSERVHREQQQVDLIRAERRELVSELATLQARLDSSVQEADAAVARAAEAESAAQQAEARQREVQSALEAAQEQLLRAQAEYDEAVAAQDRVAVELRTVRVAAQEHATQTLPDLELPAGETPMDDLGVIALVARTLHEDYVDQGRAEGQRLRDEAAASAERLLAAAREQADEMARGAQTEHDRLSTEAQARHKEMLEEGRAEQARLRAHGQQEHDRLVSEAEEQRAGILADLNARRELLEARVAELDRSQREYRERLRALVQQQLSALDDDGWRSA